MNTAGSRGTGSTAATSGGTADHPPAGSGDATGSGRSGDATKSGRSGDVTGGKAGTGVGPSIADWVAAVTAVRELPPDHGCCWSVT